jgi:hypothetical protein
MGRWADLFLEAVSDGNQDTRRLLRHFDRVGSIMVRAAGKRSLLPTGGASPTHVIWVHPRSTRVRCNDPSWALIGRRGRRSGAACYRLVIGAWEGLSETSTSDAALERGRMPDGRASSTGICAPWLARHRRLVVQDTPPGNLCLLINAPLAPPAAGPHRVACLVRVTFGYAGAMETVDLVMACHRLDAHW